MNLGEEWEDLWEALNSAFIKWANDVRACNQDMYWFAEHHETESFPFGAVAGFGKAGIPGESDVVLSFSVQEKDGGYLVMSDVATDEGRVIAQATDVFVSGFGSDVQMWSELARCKDDFQRMVEGNFDEIRNTVCV